MRGHPDGVAKAAHEMERARIANRRELDELDGFRIVGVQVFARVEGRTVIPVCTEFTPGVACTGPYLLDVADARPDIRDKKMRVRIEGQRLGAMTDDKGEYVIGSTMIMVEYRDERQRVFAGRQRHWLRREGSQIRIVQKRVDLINCDSAFEAMAVPI